MRFGQTSSIAILKLLPKYLSHEWPTFLKPCLFGQEYNKHAHDDERLYFGKNQNKNIDYGYTYIVTIFIGGDEKLDSACYFKPQAELRHYQGRNQDRN